MNASKAIQELSNSLAGWTIPVRDISATWVMNQQFEFICTHDTTDHSETIIMDTVRNGEHDEYEVIIHVCDNCDGTIKE